MSSENLILLPSTYNTSLFTWLIKFENSSDNFSEERLLLGPRHTIF